MAVVWALFAAGCSGNSSGTDGPDSGSEAGPTDDADGTSSQDVDDRTDGSCASDANQSTESSCADGTDNDCDGKTDCDDPDCTGSACGLAQGSATCRGQECVELLCYDGADNDRDGKTDCADSDCVGETCADGTDRECPAPDAWETDETTCDETDNDCDGATDEGCSCAYDPADFDHVDADGDNTFGVCADQTQDESGMCPKPSDFEPSESNCGDGLDNDCDGDTDCDDSDCSGEACGAGQGGAICQSSACAERTCYDGRDNDGDGMTDCADPDCTGQTCNQGTNTSCPDPSDYEPGGEMTTGDGIDNDCDGATDESGDCIYDPTESNNVDTDDSHNSGVCRGETRDSSGNCTKPTEFQSRTSNESFCNDDDNDCDGISDEGCACTYDPNEGRNIDTDQSNDEGVCRNQSIDPNNGNCATPTTYDSPTDQESRCDGTDHDCDGITDEGCTCVYDPSDADDIDSDNSQNGGVCVGQTIDPSGTCTTPGKYEDPEGVECADGQDNDCDGTTDESPRPKAPGDSCSADCECTTNACENRTCAHRVFVTSMNYDADFSGNPDGTCKTRANDASLTGAWGAIVAPNDSTSAKSKITVTGPVYNLNGDKLASGTSDLWDGKLANSVTYNEFGMSDGKAVWTGAASDGSAKSTCNGWYSSSCSRVGRNGVSGATNGKWLDSSNRDCCGTRALYCINGQ